MSIDKIPFNKLKTLDEINKAADSINTTGANLDINIFEGLDSKKFNALVNKSKVGNDAESIFFKNIDSVGSENVFTALDKNNDGVLQEDEIAEMAGLDGDNKGLSSLELKLLLHDIIGKAMNVMKIEAPEVEDKLNSMLPTGDDYYNMPSSGGYSAPSTSSANQVYGPNTNQRSDFAGMSLDQLNTEKTTLESNVSSAKEAVEKAKTEVTTAETELQEKTKAFEDAQKVLDEQNASMKTAINADGSIEQTKKDKLAEFETKISEKDTAITENGTKITTKEGEITANNEAVEGKRTAISSKDSEISTAEGSLSQLRSSLSSVGEGKTEEEKTANANQKADIEGQISDAEAKLSKLREERSQLEKERNELTEKGTKLQEELTTLKSEKTTLENDKNTLLSQKSELTNEIALNCGPTAKDAISKYNEMKSNFDKAQTAKTEAQTKLDTAKQTLTAKEAELDVQTDKLSQIKVIIQKKESNTVDEELIENAKKYIGYNEGDGSYKLFTNGRTEAWCADFVSYVTKETYGKDLPEGFGSPSVSNLYQWGIDNNRTVDKNNVEMGQVMIQKSNGASHTGLVTAVDRDANGNVTAIHTIEGNTSNQVAERTYKPGDSGFDKITCFIDLNN